MRLTPVLLLVATMVLGWSMPAQAHSALISSDPTEGARLDVVPEQIVLTFSESVRQPSEASLVVDGDVLTTEFTVSGARFVVEPPADAPDGSYQLNYRVVSADGHPISGTVAFTVGEAAAVVSGDDEAVETSPNSTQDDSPWSPPVLLGGAVAVVVLAAIAALLLRGRPRGSDDARP